MKVEDDHWLIGFTEGEGCFGSKWKPNRNKDYPHFALVNTDYSSLRKAKGILGVGTITVKPTSGNRKPCYVLSVSNKVGLETVRRFFKGRLRTDFKKRQFAEFESVLNICYLSKEEFSAVRSKAIKKCWDNPIYRENRLHKR